MKGYLRRFAVLSALLLTFTTFSCGKDKVEEINDSQEQSESDYSGKTEITLGMPGFNVLISPAVTEFNEISESSRLKIVDYSKLVNENDTEKILNQMKMDLVSGRAPDIIVLCPAYMSDFVRTGAFTDMYELMEQYDGVKKEDFLENALRGFDVNGELPALSYSYRIQTAVAKTENVGAGMENWTADEAMAAFEAMPEGMRFCCYDDEYSLADFMMKRSADSSTDLINCTCDFSREEFTELLDFCGRNPVRGEYSSDDELFMDEAAAIIENRQLVREIYIGAFEQSTGNMIWTDFNGEDVTFTGYPSETGCGAVTTSDWMFGISESCQNKQAAWEFINYLLSESFQKKTNEQNCGIPVMRGVMEDFLANKDREDSASIYYSRLKNERGLMEGEPIPEETVQKIYDYITNVEFEPYWSFDIDDIVREEYSAVVAGDKSGEQCAEILQSRVSIYLGERK